MIEFEGSYNEFKEIIISKIERKKTKKVKTLTKKVNNDKEIRLIEKQIHSIENKIKQLESESYKEDVFNDYKKINKINKTIKELEEELATCDKQYYELLNL